MKRMLAIDFDGTLLDPAGQVTPRTREAVRRAVEAGVEVVFATGRNRWESLKVLEAVEHEAYAVFVGGALTLNLATQKTIDRRLLDGGRATAICDVLQRHGLSPLVLQDRDLSDVDFIHGPIEIPQRVRDWHELHGLRVREVDDLAMIDHAATLRVSTLGPADASDVAERELNDGTAGDVFAYQVDLANFGVRLLEAFSNGVNKWTALERLAAMLEVDPGNITAVGDDMNDLQMVQYAGVGVAMGNARPPVKAVADRVVASNADEGLAVFIEEYLA
jgi:Cof subfamily protein (haloacid dehalogenase superfamily)